MSAFCGKNIFVRKRYRFNHKEIENPTQWFYKQVLNWNSKVPWMPSSTNHHWQMRMRKLDRQSEDRGFDSHLSWNLFSLKISSFASAKFLDASIAFMVPLNLSSISTCKINKLEFLYGLLSDFTLSIITLYVRYRCHFGRNYMLHQGVIIFYIIQCKWTNRQI